MKIFWSQRALKHIDGIGNFIALDSPERAAIFVRKLLDSTERLIKFSLSGSNVPSSPNLKQIIVQGYRIIYRAKDQKIEILSVLSPAQL